MKEELNNLLSEIEEEYGGDITFISPSTEKKLENTESKLGYILPRILRYFYTEETNGIQIDNKLIYSVLDENEKKTFSNNLVRSNDPNTSYWFKYKPEIFKDYLVIGADGELCFAIYKHLNLDNPSIYLCENPNTKEEVILENLEIDLRGLIETMIENSF